VKARARISSVRVIRIMYSSLMGFFAVVRRPRRRWAAPMEVTGAR